MAASQFRVHFGSVEGSLGQKDISNFVLSVAQLWAFLVLFNSIPTRCCHVTLIYGLIAPMAGRNRVKQHEVEVGLTAVLFKLP